MKILYLQYANPGAYPPLEHGARIFADRGWRVRALGVLTPGTEALEFSPHPNIQTRCLAICLPGWRQKLHFLRFGLLALGWVLWWRPQWVYVSDPLACPAGWLLSWLPGCRVVYHEHDSPTLNPRRPESAFQAWILWSRTKLARRAEFCVLPNAERIRQFQTQTGTRRPVLLVWNCPSTQEAGPEAGRRPAESEKFIVFYHGSIVPARVPLTVVQALGLLPPQVCLQLAGYETIGHKGYVAELLAEARRLGVGDRVEYLGVFRHDALLPLCRRASVGLALMPRASGDLNEQTMAGASNKPFEYLACGVPLLVTDLPEWRTTFVEPGYARACDPEDVRSLAQAIREFFEQPGVTREMGQRGRERILHEWNYEGLFALVLHNIVERQDGI